MPASSVSGLLGWGFYVTAAMLLVGSLMPALDGVYEYAGEADVVQVASGVAQVLNGLRPGIVAVLHYESPGENVTVALQGNVVQAAAGGVTASRYCRWQLPLRELVPGRTYDVVLRGTEVEVETPV